MDPIVSRCIAQAGMTTATASLDREATGDLLLLSGWLSTAADRALDVYFPLGEVYPDAEFVLD